MKYFLAFFGTLIALFVIANPVSIRGDNSSAFYIVENSDDSDLIICNMTLSAHITHQLCSGDNSASIDLTVTGGVPPYTFSWSNGAVTEDLNSIIPGTYTVQVTDNDDCIDVTQTFEVLSANYFNLDMNTPKNVTCFGDSDGSARIEGFGGKRPYTFLWSSGQTTDLVTGLSPGFYSVTVTDANGCERIRDNIEVKEPDYPLTAIAHSIPVSCAYLDDGFISLVVTGGTKFRRGNPSYMYQWSNGTTTQHNGSLSKGIYSVTVTDANGCRFELDDIEIDAPTEELIVTDNVLHVSCKDGNDGEISLDIVGGSSPYKFRWDGGERSNEILHLSPGDYSVSVTDEFNCTVEISKISVTEPDSLLIYLDTVIHLTAMSEGAIHTTIKGGTQPYRITWKGPGNYTSDTTDIDLLKEGKYQITVLDSNDCETLLKDIFVKGVILKTAGNFINNSITIFPNPIIDELHILTNSNPPYKISIFSPEGKIIRNIVIYSNDPIDLSSLKSGYYLIRLEDSIGRFQTRSFIKN